MEDNSGLNITEVMTKIAQINTDNMTTEGSMDTK